MSQKKTTDDQKVRSFTQCEKVEQKVLLDGIHFDCLHDRCTDTEDPDEKEKNHRLELWELCKLHKSNRNDQDVHA